MFQRFSNIFSVKHENVTESVEENLDMDKINEEIKSLNDELSEDILIESCDHGWVDYDHERFNILVEDFNYNTLISKNKIENLLIKSIEAPLDIVNRKMIEIYIMYSPSIPEIEGKCMVCGKEVIVMYVDENMRNIIY